MQKEQLFGVFGIYDADGGFLGLSSGHQATVVKTWASRGTLRFEGDRAILETHPQPAVTPSSEIK